MSAMIGNIDWGINGPDDEEAATDRVILPLNLIALIISHLDDAGDYARACRASRVLHYMTLPALYRNVSLHSYDHIRYSQETSEPEGCGGPSPFTMGLNALVTRNVASYVHHFKVWGNWKEYDLDECAKAGRVPDSSMILSMLVRTAIDRCTDLKSFSWDLDTKMLPTVWIGLAQRSTLQSLMVAFPTARLPRPTLMVPAMQNLKSLTLTNIDPLCYPDNISQLLVGSSKLEILKMHWSPRMRNAREASTNLHSYFGRAIATDYRMPLKSLSFQNLYANNENLFREAIDVNKIESFTLINSLAGANDPADMAFIDQSWKIAPKVPMPKLRTLRGDKVNTMHINMLKKFQGLQKYYLLSGRILGDRPFTSKTTNIAYNDHASSTTGTPQSGLGSYADTPIAHQTPASPTSTMDGIATIAGLGPQYLDTIFKFHGASLRHLLLRPEWRFTSEDIARMIRDCPNLEQVGFGVDTTNFNILRMMVPFLPKLYAVRMLDSPDSCDLTDAVSAKSEDWYIDQIGTEAYMANWKHLRWMGIGDYVFEINLGSTVVQSMDGGNVAYRKKVTRRPLVSVHDVEIWAMDRFEI